MQCSFSVRCCALIAAVIAADGCTRQHDSKTFWRLRFGPVITNELVVGRVISNGAVWIATGTDAIVRIDIDGAVSTRRRVHPLMPGEHIWGLASTGPDVLWTLIGRTVLAQVAEDGEVVKRIALAEPHVGIYSAGRELLYQLMDFHPPADALRAGPPGGARRRAWSRMRTRELPLVRGAVAALNLVACGPTAGSSVPCWFPDQAAVTLTDMSGASREIALEGLPVVAPELLLSSDNPRRPVRDAFVSAGNHVWVLGSGEAPSPELSMRPGGWLLARYDSDGRLFRRVQLPEAARFILAAADDRCTLLAWDGRVVEVRP